ncbi:MAG: hypothetical protein JNJ57_12455 [Saprospiraceae bacterium]|nr:hypothetical protein [Saprospiraceae bacterium]
MTDTYISPDGRFKLHISPIPMRMSHEVLSPTLYDEQSGEILFDPGGLWDAGSVVWAADSRTLSMLMRHYDNGLRSYRCLLDMELRTGKLIFEEKELFAGPFHEFEMFMKSGDF